MGALIDSGYALIACRDNLYTFKYEHVTVLVNTYVLTGNYAVISITNCQGQIKLCRAYSISELNALIRDYKIADKVDMKLYRTIKLNPRKKLPQLELNFAV